MIQTAYLDVRIKILLYISRCVFVFIIVYNIYIVVPWTYTILSNPISLCHTIYKSSLHYILLYTIHHFTLFTPYIDIGNEKAKSYRKFEFSGLNNKDTCIDASNQVWELIDSSSNVV